MNWFNRALLPLLMLSDITCSSLDAMHTEGSISGETPYKKELFKNFKELPQELKLYIISLLLQSSIEPGFMCSNVCQLAAGSKSFAFSPEGKSFFIGLRNGIICLLNSTTGKLVESFGSSQDTLYSVRCSADQKNCLTGSDKGDICVWDLASKEQVRAFQVPYRGALSALVFSSDGEAFFIGWMGGEGCLLSTKTGKELTTFIGHQDSVHSCAFSLDMKLCLTGSFDNTARLWDCKTGHLLTVFNHTDCVAAVSFSQTGKQCLTGAADGTAGLWNLETRKSLLFKGDVGIFAVSFSPDGETFLTAHSDGAARLWDCKIGQLLATFSVGRSYTHIIAFRPDGEAFIAGSGPTTSLWKRLYGFRCLTEEKKEKSFKQFLSFYPLIMQSILQVCIPQVSVDTAHESDEKG